MKIISLAAGSVLLLTALATNALSAQQRVALPAQDKVLNEKPVQQFGIGAEDGESWELLSGVRSVAFDANENLYVLDGNNYRVLVFDPNGRFLRQIGKQGGGPGELMLPLTLAVTSDNRIVIGDLGRRVLSIFKTDGTFVKNVPLEQGQMLGGGGAGSALQTHPRGGVIGMITTTPRLNAPGNAPGAGGGVSISPSIGRNRSSAVSWWDLRTDAGKDIYEYKLPDITPKIDTEGNVGSQRTMVMLSPPVFSPPNSFGVLPDGSFALVNDADYRIQIVGADGKVARLLERPIPAKKATEADKATAMKRRKENSARGGARMFMTNVNGSSSVSTAPPPGTTEQSIEQMMRDATFLDVIPVVQRMATDPQGRIWVQRTAADQGLAGPVDILMNDGRYVGTVPAARIPGAVSRSGRAAYVETDPELGIERVVVRRLPPSWSAGECSVTETKAGGRPACAPAGQRKSGS